MNHKEPALSEYVLKQKPNKSSRDALIEAATKACSVMDGAAQIGSTHYWFVDADKFEIVRKK